MKLEQQTIQIYKKTFPFETLRETSERTGIQVTRIFRLFAGRKMRVQELEAFQRAIDLKNGTTKKPNELHTLIQELILTLDEGEMSYITDYLVRKLENKKYQSDITSHSILMNRIA